MLQLVTLKKEIANRNAKSKANITAKEIKERLNTEAQRKKKTEKIAIEMLKMNNKDLTKKKKKKRKKKKKKLEKI